MSRSKVIDAASVERLIGSIDRGMCDVIDAMSDSLVAAPSLRRNHGLLGPDGPDLLVEWSRAPREFPRRKAKVFSSRWPGYSRAHPPSGGRSDQRLQQA